MGSDGPGKEIEVRKYAIERLARADNSDLEMFLLQLVQALKYENIQENESAVQMTQMAMLQESMQNINLSQVKNEIIVKILDSLGIEVPDDLKKQAAKEQAIDPHAYELLMKAKYAYINLRGEI